MERFLNPLDLSHGSILERAQRKCLEKEGKTWKVRTIPHIPVDQSDLLICCHQICLFVAACHCPEQCCSPGKEKTCCPPINVSGAVICSLVNVKMHSSSD